MKLRDIGAGSGAERFAAESRKWFQSAFSFAPAGVFGVTSGQVAIVARLNFAAAVFIDIRAAQNPGKTQARQTVFYPATLVRIAPRSTCVIKANWLVRLHAAVKSFGRMQRDFAQWHANFRMQFSCNVNLRRIRKLIGALWPD